MNTHVVALVHEGDLHGVSRDRSGERQNKGSEELHFEAFVNECWSERMGVWGERNPRVSNETGGGGEKGRGILNVTLLCKVLYPSKWRQAQSASVGVIVRCISLHPLFPFFKMCDLSPMRVTANRLFAAVFPSLRLRSCRCP